MGDNSKVRLNPNEIESKFRVGIVRGIPILKVTPKSNNEENLTDSEKEKEDNNTNSVSTLNLN